MVNLIHHAEACRVPSLLLALDALEGIQQSPLGISLTESSSSTITDPTTTTPSKSTQTCKADEEWQLKNNLYGCFCKDPYKVTDLSQVVPQLTCGLYEMTATFHKCQFNDLNIYFNKTHVKDNDCFNFQDDPVTNTFSVLAPLQVGSCRVQTYVSDRNGTHVTYTSSITIVVDEPGAIYIRKNTLKITLLCAYELDLITSLNPIISSINIVVPGIGTFQATLAIYIDSSYKNPYTGSEVALSTEEFLYIKVFIQDGDTSNLVLVMKNCYATPSNDVNDPLKYYIIQNSCPNMQDNTINVLENGVSRQGRFSVKMFKFVGNYNEVYLHCAVSLCDSDTGPCAPNCPTGGSRSDATGTPKSYDAPAAMTSGPIKRSGEPASSTVNISAPPEDIQRSSDHQLPVLQECGHPPE
ncbi:uromodulin-like [Aquarana catesbeiana]|uniref:uromodulin-like n=1 Tax=Aquarana catesbeiana TaxID=8400 RepID=UPI003CC9AEC8